MKTKLQEGQKAPDFCLVGLDEKGNEKKFCLKDFRGKKVILYFYPKDNTPGCTTEALDFKKYFLTLKKKGFVVVGVSPDSIESHKKFKEKHGLPFILLSDENKQVAEKYGVYGEKKRFGRVVKGIIRSTFIIDENGNIVKTYYNVKAKGHVEQILNDL